MGARGSVTQTAKQRKHRFDVSLELTEPYEKAKLRKELITLLLSEEAIKSVSIDGERMEKAS